jgi:hypothetical protein
MELPEYQHALNLLVGIVLAAGGWFAREVWVAMKDLRASVHKIEVEVPKGYVAKGEFIDIIKELRTDINRGFDRLHDKIDGKEDKR